VAGDESWEHAGKHPDKDVRKLFKALKKASVWTLEWPFGHWGRLRCPGALVDGELKRCSVPVFGTTQNQPKVLREKVAKCPHGHSWE